MTYRILSGKSRNCLLNSEFTRCKNLDYVLISWENRGGGGGSDGDGGSGGDPCRSPAETKRTADGQRRRRRRRRLRQSLSSNAIDINDNVIHPRKWFSTDRAELPPFPYFPSYSYGVCTNFD